MPAPKRDRNRKIRRMAARGWKFAAIGRRFGISRQRVDQIVKPVRAACRETFKEAVRSGRLERPDVCENCGASGPVDGHHEDYSAPLDVEWLCVRCHRERHAGPKRKVARRRVLFECETCGKVERVKPSLKDRRRFCSRDCTPPRGRQYTDDDLLDHLRHLANDLGRTPTLSEVQDSSGPSFTTYYDRFGTYTEACELVGLEPRGTGGAGHLTPEEQEAA